MSVENNLKKGIRNRFLGCIFAFVLMLTSLFGLGAGFGMVENAYAEPDTDSEQTSVTTSRGVTCEDSLGSLGWLVCPATGKISEAVDWLYEKIQGILVVNPVKAEDGTPVYEIWKYFQGVTNILFAVFLLIVVYSQVTGMGTNNYGVKKALPKLIVAAVLVNLSFYICSLAVDVSNIFGEGLRGLFESIEASTMSQIGTGSSLTWVEMSEMYGAMADGTTLAIGGAVIAFETGAIWMLIPLALGALLSVVIGLVTIAMRQAVVTLLIMIAPLAMVAYILPNTEQWFRKWRQLLMQMLVFYPAFSLLFGASSVAGWAIIVSSQSGFGVLIGTAVQIFPLFFSWSLMKMSGTFLGSINSKLHQLAAAPLGGVRNWAGSHRDLTRAKNLASRNAYTPSLRLMQYLEDRKTAREEETKEYLNTAKNRGLAYAAMRNYRRDGETPSKEGEESYDQQAQNMEYQRMIKRHVNNMNKGLGQLEAVKNGNDEALKERLGALDMANVLAADDLKMEEARGEMIEYRNAQGFHNRMNDAMNAHSDALHGEVIDPKTGRRIGANPYYKRHLDLDSTRGIQAQNRYQRLSEIMEGDVQSTHYAAATAAQNYSTQSKMVSTKMQTYMEMTPPTKDAMYRIDEMIKQHSAANDIDLILPGLRTLNMRGDTDLLKQQIDNILDREIGGGLQLGTQASQALASFLMFEVKDADPWLRRFGKYINLETARAYNKNERQELNFNYDEYIKGYHMELNPETGKMEKFYARKGMAELMEGTSLDNIERTALSNFDDSLKKTYSYIGEDGKEHLNIEEYLSKREQVQKSIGPQFISASLKYLSGSEQLTSAVKFLTGYGLKQAMEEFIDENNVPRKRIATDDNGNPRYEWKAVWDDSIYADNPEKVREHYQRKTLQYLGDQTPSQILGLRSDYKDPLLGHLAQAYQEETDMDGWSEEAREEHEEYMREWSDIQTRYGDLPPEEAKRKRDADMRALKNKMAGAEFRQLLDKKGKLNQIYRTRRSGAANNAKDWVRDWLDLDNEVEITIKLENDKRKLKEAHDKAKAEKDRKARAEGDVPEDTADNAGRIYTESDMAMFVSKVDDMWHDLREEDDDVFYEESLEYIQKTLGRDSFIVAQYQDFRKDDPYADSHMLKEYLVDLLNDPENY